MKTRKNLTLKLDDFDFMILYGILLVEQVRSKDCPSTSDEIRNAQDEMIKQLEELQKV